MMPEAVLPSRPGIVNGETRRGPFSASLAASASNVPIPPKAEPTITPIRERSQLASSIPACVTAMRAAATAKWVYLSFCLTDLAESK